MSARRIVRTGGHTGPPLRWEFPTRRAVHPKRSRPSFRNEKKLRILLAYELRTHIVTRYCGTNSELISSASGGTYDDEREIRDRLTGEECVTVTGEKL